MSFCDENRTWQCEHVIPSNLTVARRLLDELLARLEELQWSCRDIFGVHLAVDEALVNAVRHGNKCDADKRLRFFWQLTPRKVRVEIIDEGQGFDPNCLPDPTALERLICPDGRGVWLMKAFMTRVEFYGCGNHVILEKERSN